MTAFTITERFMMNEDVKNHTVHTGPAHKKTGHRGPRHNAASIESVTFVG